MSTYKQFIEEVKRRNPIEEVIEASGMEFKLERRTTAGGWVRGLHHDSLNVNVENGFYRWWAKGDLEKGDVFSWVMARNPGWDFQQALEYLVRRAGMEMPRFEQNITAAELGMRKREDIWTLAQPIFARWLKESEQAMQYLHEVRAWSDKTIEEAGLGYSGKTEAHRAEMINALRAAGVDPETPGGVSLLGFKGDVLGWSKKYDISPNDEWVEGGYIPGIMTGRRLIYPHFQHGRVCYYSCRNILGSEMQHGREIKSFNLPVALAGKRQLYFNTCYGRKAESIVLVEGPGDAVSLYQMGQPGVAIIGKNIQDFSEEIAELRERHQTIYWGLDSDAPGMSSLRDEKTGKWPVLATFGPKVRHVRWDTADGYNTFATDNEGAADDVIRQVKDANDLLRAMKDKGDEDPSLQHNVLVGQLEQARMMVMIIAEWAGNQKGAWRDQAEQQAVEAVAALSAGEYAQYRTEIARLLHRTNRDLENMIKRFKDSQRAAQAEDVGEPHPTLGGFVKDHLIDYIYDQEEERAYLAVRFPDGRAEVVDHVSVNGVRYVPLDPEPLIIKGVVRFPSALSPLRPTRELLSLIRIFIHTYLDVDKFFERLASFYVLFSWLYDCFPILPYLRALGDYGTGKTRFIETIGVLCYRPMFTAGATSTSALFRMIEQYRGTLILDEADFSQSTEQADVIKVLNVGNKKGGNVIKSVDSGNGAYLPTPFYVFCPKVIATRKKFGDEATESRCLTKEMGSPTIREDIPLVEPKEFNLRAREIRNLLLAYRLKYWVPDFEVDYNAADRSIEPRLNQVSLPLKSLIGHDEPEMIEEIDAFVRHYNHQIIVQRSMRVEAKVLEAIVQLAAEADAPRTSEGDPDLRTKAIAERANKIIDAENADEDNDNNLRKLTPKGAGSYIRNQLQLNTDKKMDGYHLIWDRGRIEALRRRYGVD